ncbi:hypothetical protein ColLi_09258 [Colletotrichum liriopes]|uniref:Uncharacterized protein n=1 Tax=Colletotrichum liriopes TaxID=708192 RepID=A0AA37GSM1_9PEZI|nr:hypothetical protein ColLi_09258 [Colletotrichum liriopes]
MEETLASKLANESLTWESWAAEWCYWIQCQVPRCRDCDVHLTRAQQTARRRIDALANARENIQKAQAVTAQYMEAR